MGPNTSTIIFAGTELKILFFRSSIFPVSLSPRPIGDRARLKNVPMARFKECATVPPGDIGKLQLASFEAGSFEDTACHIILQHSRTLALSPPHPMKESQVGQSDIGLMGESLISSLSNHPVGSGVRYVNGSGRVTGRKEGRKEREHRGGERESERGPDMTDLTNDLSGPGRRRTEEIRRCSNYKRQF